VTPERIAAALARLREAGRALRRRPARERISSLARVLDGWRDSDSPWLRALESELPAATGFSPPVVREGLRLGLEPFSGAALRALVDREIGAVERLDEARGTMVSGFETTSLVLAGAIPMPTMLSILAPLVLASPVLAKAAASDPVTPRLFARSIAEVDEELGRAVEVVAFPGDDAACTAALLGAGCVVATGSDATVASLRARVAPARRLVTYGHRVSVAALGPDATRGRALEEVAPRIARDVALWDQLGCLSPVTLYVADPDERAVDRVADALAGSLAALERELPRGGIGPGAAAAIAAERAEAELRRAAGAGVRLLASEGSEWTVVREDGVLWRSSPLHRFVRVVPTSGARALLDALAPSSAHLAAVALAGFGDDGPALARALADLGASRLCAPGRLQGPPLAWHHDGGPVLIPVARFSDWEEPV
jgi:hypothetical protein